MMLYLVIISIWTFMFFLMVIYMCIEIKQSKYLNDWCNKASIEINANKARIDALEDKVKRLEKEASDV